MQAGYKTPTPIGGLIYPSRVHTLAGPPEAGKTVLALWIAVKIMERGQRVLMLDEETGRGQIADLLRSMGADPDMIHERFYYTAFNDLPWKGDDIEQLALLLDAWKPRLSIFDSAGEMLSSAGINENDPSEVTRFYKIVLRPVAAKFRSAVLLLDHDAKGGDKQSRYARGSTAKLAVPDVAIKLTPLRPFNRSQDGVLGMTIAKDRLGSLHRWYRIRVSSSPLALEFTKTTHADETDGGSGMSPSAEKLLDVITEVPQTSQALVDAVVAKYGHGLRRETVSRALNTLVEQQLIDRMDLGKFQSPLWVKHNVGRLGSQEEEDVPPPSDPV